MEFPDDELSETLFILNIRAAPAIRFIIVGTIFIAPLMGTGRSGAISIQMNEM